MSGAELWLLIIGMGLITYGQRSGSLILGEHLPMTPAIRSFLRFVPVAVLSAISAIELFLPDGSLNISLVDNPRLLAGAVAILVAMFTRRMLPTIAAGMLALWILQAVL